MSELFGYRDEHSDLEPALDADETEERALDLADTWNPNLTPRPFIHSTTHPLSSTDAVSWNAPLCRHTAN